jgi:hypothetical protein
VCVIFLFSPNLISNESISDSWSTISPLGVADLDLQAAASVSDASCSWPNESLYLDNLEDDPLEWLLHGEGMNHLPESSIPIFPEFEGSLVPNPIVNIADSLNIADPKISVQSLFLDT